MKAIYYGQIEERCKVGIILERYMEDQYMLDSHLRDVGKEEMGYYHSTMQV